MSKEWSHPTHLDRRETATSTAWEAGRYPVGPLRSSLLTPHSSRLTSSQR
jgi:hypothetical protein